MKDSGTADELLRIIEEQADTIMQAENTICRMARLLVEKYEVTQAELAEVIGIKDREERDI